MNAEVHELVRRWLLKAENDLRAGLAVMQAVRAFVRERLAQAGFALEDTER